MNFQSFGRISHPVLCFSNVRLIGIDLGLHLGPNVPPKARQMRLQKDTKNMISMIDFRRPNTPKKNLSRIEREARFKIAKANTPYAQRKQVNLTSQEIVETILETKKGRTPYPQGEHAH